MNASKDLVVEDSYSPHIALAAGVGLEVLAAENIDIPAVGRHIVAVGDILAGVDSRS